MPKGIYKRTEKCILRGENARNWKGGKPKCIDCGKLLINSRAKRCGSHARSFIMRGRYGSLAPRWQGGKCSNDYLERRRFRREVQKAVFERDDYTCQLCGVRGKNIQVDHIQPWAEYIEQRFSMDNCRTLCAQCHYKITFGKPMSENIRAWGHNLLRGEVDIRSNQ